MSYVCHNCTNKRMDSSLNERVFSTGSGGISIEKSIKKAKIHPGPVSNIKRDVFSTTSSRWDGQSSVRMDKEIRQNFQPISQLSEEQELHNNIRSLKLMNNLEGKDDHARTQNRKERVISNMDLSSFVKEAF